MLKACLSLSSRLSSLSSRLSILKTSCYIFKWYCNLQKHDQSWFIIWEYFSLIIFFFYEKIFPSGRKIISIILIDWKLLWMLEIQSIPFLRRGTLTIFELKDYLMFRQTVSELKDYLILIELDDKIRYKFGRNAINELAVT